MYKHNGFNLKKLLSTLACFLLIVAMTFSVACSNDDSDSSSSSSSSSAEATVTATDYQTLKNGDFEFGTSKKEDKDFPVSSGINWTRSNDSLAASAPSSSKSSGVINTEDAAYNAIAEKNSFPKDGDSYFNPHTPEYYGLVKDDAKYIYNEDTAEDNPNADGLVTSGSKILMIHNVTTGTGNDGRGTAQKFTSSTTLSTSTGYGKLSVWVLTKDLKTVQNTEDFGAYISVVNTLSSTRSPFIVKNINTNGNWVQYNVYVEASDYASSSFKVVLGLGFGGKNYTREFVEGYAYFDNVHFEELEKDEYVTATEGIDNAAKYSIFDSNGEDVDASSLIVSQTGAASTANGEKADAFNQTNFDATTKHSFVLSHLIENAPLALDVEDDGAGKIGEVNDVLSSNIAHGTDAVVKYDTFANIGIGTEITNPAADDAKALYISLPTKSSYTVTSKPLSLDYGKNLHVAFNVYVDIEAPKGVGAKIEVEEVDTNGNVLGKASTVASNINTYSSEDKKSVWQDVSIFLNNNVLVTNDNDDTNDTRYYRIKFTLGTTDDVNTYPELTKGVAIFAGFESKELTEKEYGIVSSADDYKATFALGNEYLNGAEDDDESTDSYTFNPTAAYKPSFDKDIARAIVGYTGVVGGHTMVGGDKSAYSQDNTVAGLVNNKNTYDGLDLSFLTGLETGENKNVQPIVIKNDAASYGFLGQGLTLAANTTTHISVKVKVVDATAKAYVYLVNAEALSNFEILTVAVDGEDAQPLMAEITSTSTAAASGWVEVNFVITTGDEAITYRVELWNGSRDGATLSTGLVAFDQFATTTSVNVNTLKTQLATYGEAEGDVVEKSHTRAPSKVTITNDDGEEEEITRTYSPEVNFTKYVKGNSIFASYATIHAATELDETTPSTDDSTTSDSSSSEEVADPTGNNWALQLTSIIIAAVLVAVLAFVLIRMLVKKNKKAEVATTSYYSRDSREANQARINANKAKRAAAEQRKAEELAKAEAEAAIPVEEAKEEAVEETVEETVEEEVVEEYDYDNPENNIKEDEEPKGE